jgi:hypothetical protein
MDTEFHANYVGFSEPDCDRRILKDSTGRYRTNLFYEFNKARQEDYPPLYTMREEPWMGLPSAYQIYMFSDSEYEAALKLVGSWHHWQRLLKSRPFVEGTQDGVQWTGLQVWRDEKEIRDKATAYNQLKMNAAQGNVQAQKMIFDGKTASKRGRPSKAEIAKAAQEQAQSVKELRDDLKRIKLVATDGKSPRVS